MFSNATAKSHPWLFNIFDSFEDFVASHCFAVENDNTLNITYEFLSYDLIDKDLDFNEEYYKQLCKNFNKMLLRECKTLMDDELYTKIAITQSLKLMTNYGVLERRFELTSKNMVSTKYSKLI